jgi:hypothetical protein
MKRLGYDAINETIMEYFERTKPLHFYDFQFRIQGSYLFDKTKDVFNQDFTMLVGMFKEFFRKKLDIDCGVSPKEIKKAIDRL